MTIASLITVNAVLAAVLVFGIVRLLVHGILTDRHSAGPGVVVRPAAADERDRLAA